MPYQATTPTSSQVGILHVGAPGESLTLAKTGAGTLSGSVNYIIMPAVNLGT